MRVLDRLQTRLNIAFLLLSVVPLVVVLALVTRRSYEFLEQNAYDYLQEHAARIAEQVEGLLHSRTSVLTFIARAYALQDDEPSVLAGALLASDTAFQEVAILNADGMEIARVSRLEPVFPDDLVNRAETPEYRVIRENGISAYYGPVRFEGGGVREPLLMIAVPHYDPQTNALTRILIADFRFRTVWEVLAAAALRAGESVMVLDASTDLVAHNNPSLVLQGMDIALPELGTGIMSHVDGQEALYARQDIFLGGQRFTILSQQLSSEALALAQDIRTIAGVALALTLVVVAGLAWYVVRYVVKPVEEMANIAYQLTQGDLSRQVRVEGAGEIATLGVTLNTLVDRLRSSITELKDTQDRYRTVADFTADWTYWEKPDGSLQYVSPVSQQIIGYAPEELQAQPELIHRLILPEDRAQWEAHYDRPDISEAVRRIQFRIRHRDGSVRWIEHTSRPVYDAAGDFDGYRVSNADITQRRLMEDALRTKHQELESFFRLAPDLLVIATIDGRFARVNRAWETVLGYRTDQIEGNPIADFVHPDDLDSTQQALSLLREQNPIERFTNRYRHADGSYRIIEWASQPAGDFIYAAAKDVTEREKAAAYADEIIRLRASFEREQEYSALIQQVVSALSHDVRTPLAAILMARDLLANYSERMTPQQRQEKLASIGEQINYALALVDDTMRVLRGSASEIQFNPRPVNIVALCRVSLDGVKANDAIDHNYTFR